MHQKQGILNNSTILKYLINCFLLLIPVIAWNIAFTGLLPDTYSESIFDKDIPLFILIPENIFRIAIFVLPAFMPLYIFTRIQKTGLLLYILGLFMYFLSWRPLILYPVGEWSTSLIGFTAPAITPIIWLTGIALIGYRWFFNYRFSRWHYFLLVLLFIGFHFAHYYLVYQQIF